MNGGKQQTCCPYQLIQSRSTSCNEMPGLQVRAVWCRPRRANALFNDVARNSAIGKVANWSPLLDPLVKGSVIRQQLLIGSFTPFRCRYEGRKFHAVIVTG